MKNLRLTKNVRDRERGAVAIVIAVMWMALFGMAVMAVDFGYLYTKKRNLQSVADAVLKASMPLYVQGTGITSATQTRATQVAHLSGYDDDGTNTRVQLSEPTSGQMQVSVSRKHPTFFGGVFGLTPRLITASAIGQANPGASGALIQALASGACVAPIWGAGFFAQSGPGTTLTVNGSIESNSQVFFGQGGGGTVTGTVSTDCLTPLNPTFNPYSTTVAGGQNTILMGSVTDSINASLASLDAFCTHGTSVFTPMPSGTVLWTNTGGLTGCDTPADGVYCSSDPINISPSVSTSICPGSKATFISQGQLTFGANTAIQLAAGTGAPNNLVAASFSNLGSLTCSGGFDIFMGSAGTYVLTGNLYAPNGCIAFGGARATTGFTMTGKMVGANLDLQMSPGKPWVFNAAGGGGGGGTWKMIR
jgi:hypothetical protein